LRLWIFGVCLEVVSILFHCVFVFFVFFRVLKFYTIIRFFALEFWPGRRPGRKAEA
jgi:hypothetical protein